jgi:hypothetical protein
VTRAAIRLAAVSSILVLAVAIAVASCGGDETEQAVDGGTTSASVPVTDVAPMPSEMPKSFEFSLGFGVDAKNVLDVAPGGKAHFTRDPFLGEASASFRLTPEEMTSIYQRLAELDFNKYPGAFDPPAQQTSQGTLHVTPAQSYLFIVKTDGLLHSVKWTDDDLSVDPSAVRLRRLIQSIVNLVADRPEYKALPPATGGYA